MKRIVTILLLCLLVTNHAVAEYALPSVKERLVLLLDLNDVKLDKRSLVFPIGKAEYIFNVDRFWIQDRIWSDGICVGVQDSDSKSSETRIREVQWALAKKRKSLLLIELVRVAGTTDFIVTYLKLFDPEVEYKRYFPQKTYYDTIKLPFDSKPGDSKDFVAELQKVTKSSLEKIDKNKARQKNTPDKE